MFNELIDWSNQTYIDLPWRKNRSLYRTLVSEIMLQQTTVQTVLNHFERFIEQFPNIESLALAEEEEVTIAWKGLGYYRRARNLKKACFDILENHNGEIPLNYDELVSIPGIGDYTANALISIGANKRGLPIDANIERVLSRIYGFKEEKGPKLHKVLKSEFEKKKILKGQTNYRELYESIMDLGRNFCQARKVECTLCPLKKKCVAFKNNEQLEIPFVKDSNKITKFYELELARIVISDKKKFIGEKRKENTWLSGQIEVPTFILKSEDKKLTQYPKAPTHFDLSNAKIFKTSITKYKITNYILKMTEKDFKKLVSKKLKKYDLDPEKENLSTATIKTFKKLNYL